MFPQSHQHLGTYIRNFKNNYFEVPFVGGVGISIKTF